ncbi:DNA primase small subunit [Rosa chinensis]|uniref:DNA primase small subunit n=1 Tax=Rosa chinensis TaxID=74649 RepID=UPI000D091613|nr:DNA primase small subunit [Rosa chinensis]XP_024175218.1 DNA primase small subunit [Rosa chinensis]XP_024175219.1 DNA primase small subunit [Rosa chinensis]XP_024175221.1 DNA primase small subunit [Rosa chinensis]XP_024175222.1 DNA primase small subunit [Rosa chinensis]XP_040367922.1 DNA primase small subunit [Rosa chinensis]XP_040367923.1 DNA primase small subunit [Rosa chinensis]XP_040367924.1 DNA primase small subunit [Rosa chinensis]
MPGHEVAKDDMMIDEYEQKQVNAVPDGFNSQYLKIYYGKLFPYEEMFKWMSYANDGKHPACNQSYFGRREFSFTLDNDVYLRYKTFNSVSELENSIKEKCPVKIDIGPVYNVDPAKRHSYAQSGCYPEERELIFDIDMSDYDDVRYCCSGADVCLECWPLMTIAIKVIDTALRDDFGFNHILWVYSGRRGVHCWVCDGKARRLTNELRAAIADYFRVYKGNENSHKKVSLMGPALHPFLVRSYTEVLKDFFERTLLSSQKIFSTAERYEKILDMIPDESVTSELRGKWQDNRRTSNAKEDINVARWEQLKHLLQSGKQKMQGLRRCVEEIVFSYTYPRLDMEVSKHMNHLLKAPFCVHPKTGRVCVPIDPNRCEDFDPTAVPTLSTLIEELNNEGLRAEADNDRDRTSLGKSIRFFQSSFLEPLVKSCKEEMISSYNAKLQQSKLQQSKNVLAAI